MVDHISTGEQSALVHRLNLHIDDEIWLWLTEKARRLGIRKQVGRLATRIIKKEYYRELVSREKLSNDKPFSDR